MFLSMTTPKWHQLLWVLVMILPAGKVLSYPGENYSGLTVPSALTVRQMSVSFSHRFYSALNDDPLTTYLGLSGGANVAIQAQYLIADRLSIAGASMISQREFIFETSWARDFPGGYAEAQGTLQLFAFEAPPGSGDWTVNAFPLITLSSERAFDRLRLVLDAGYDFDKNTAGLGLGVDFLIFKWIDLFFELFPVVMNRGEEGIGRDNSYAGGFSLSTYGHQFLIYAGNNPSQGTRRQMQGSSGYDPRLGFVIYRLFSFGE